MKRGNATLILELDEQLFQLRGRRLTALDNTSAVHRHKWLVTDLKGAIPRVMRVSAKPEDAAPVLEKQLREIGELSGPGEVLVHDYVRRDKRSLDCLLTGVTRTVFGDYQFAANGDSDHHLIFSFPCLLAKALKKIKPKRPAVIMIQHGRHVDLLVADHKHLYDATRVSVSQETDHERFPDLIRTVLQTAEQRSEIEIREFHFHYWLSKDPNAFTWVTSLAESMQVTCHMAPSGLLKLAKDQYHSTLPALLESLDVADSASSKKDRFLFQLHRLEPWLTVPMLAGALFLGFNALEWERKGDDLARANQTLQSRITRSLSQETKLEPNPDFEPTLALTSTLTHASKQPIPDLILREVYQSAAPRVAFDQVKMEYGENGVSVHLHGRVDKRSGQDVETFNAFIANMRRKNYIVSDSTLKADVHFLLFNLKLDRPLNESQI
ncbi:MAG: hypothetical protein HQL50_00540 [Magnetococcales bacterium]|nr:hypothetical protein [Magnetococcales bacterium]